MFGRWWILVGRRWRMEGCEKENEWRWMVGVGCWCWLCSYIIFPPFSQNPLFFPPFSNHFSSRHHFAPQLSRATDGRRTTPRTHGRPDARESATLFNSTSGLGHRMVSTTTFFKSTDPTEPPVINSKVELLTPKSSY
jgi:hypothetical protein